MKCALLEIEYTTVMIISYPDDSRSSTTKFILIVSHYIFGIASSVSSPSSKCWISLVYKHRSYVLMY